MTRFVVTSWFFVILFLAVLVWLPTVVLWDAGSSDLLVDAISNPVSLLLLVLLQNSQFRFQQAEDRRDDMLEQSTALVLEQLSRLEDDEARRRELLEAARQLREQALESTRQVTAGLQG